MKKLGVVLLVLFIPVGLFAYSSRGMMDSYDQDSPRGMMDSYEWADEEGRLYMEGQPRNSEDRRGWGMNPRNRSRVGRGRSSRGGRGCCSDYYNGYNNDYGNRPMWNEGPMWGGPHMWQYGNEEGETSPWTFDGEQWYYDGEAMDESELYNYGPGRMHRGYPRDFYGTPENNNSEESDINYLVPTTRG